MCGCSIKLSGVSSSLIMPEKIYSPKNQCDAELSMHVLRVDFLGSTM
jgi:hypothetical protein